MKKEHTQRGFALYRFKDARGIDCTVQKSSIATEDRIWIGAMKIGLTRFVPNKGWEIVDVDSEEYIANTRMELNQEQVKQLLPILQHFVETGEI